MTERVERVNKHINKIRDEYDLIEKKRRMIAK